MSYIKNNKNFSKVTLMRIKEMKESGDKISMVTCYDSAFARLIDPSPIDVVLVGDSLGNVMLGYDNTVRVTLDDMVHHTAAVARCLSRPFLVSDMPFGSYQCSAEQAFQSAVRLIQGGMAEAVKLEGGKSICPQVERIVGSGIPVVGHIGLTPQSIHVLGGYRVQGRGDEAAKQLVEDAICLEKAGACMVVLELVPADVAVKVTEALSIPTIGIGAGPGTDGQVLVLQDLLGFNSEFKPKFLKRYADLGERIASALREYVQDVSSGQFPSEDNSFS